jgi:hypothetical protein
MYCGGRIGGMSRASREKGQRRERQVVELHRAMGIKAERVPLSGAARYQGNGADVDIYPTWRDAPLIAEVKARGDGSGFKTLERWLGDCDLLCLIRDRADPMVLMPWRVYAELIKAKGTRNTVPNGLRMLLQPGPLATGEAQGQMGAEDDGGDH